MSALTRLIRFAIPPVGSVVSAVAGGLLWPARPAARADLAPPKTPGRESWVTGRGGARLRVVVYGPQDAQPIVFAHGWTCNAEVWLPQVHALADTYRVITYDQRGHGQSSLGDEPFVVERLADDLSSVLSATLRDGERAVIVGHSMGGMSIMSWGKHHPQEVRERASAVVLTGTSAHGLRGKFDVPYLGTGQLGALVADGVIQLLALPLSMNAEILKRSAAVRFIVRTLVLSPEADDAATDLTSDMALTCPAKTRAVCVQELIKNLDVRDGVRNLNVPVFVVAGAQDRLTPLTHSYEIANVLAETGWLERLVVYPGSGHMIALEATQEYNTLLLDVAEQFSPESVEARR